MQMKVCADNKFTLTEQNELVGDIIPVIRINVLK